MIAKSGFAIGGAKIQYYLFGREKNFTSFPNFNLSVCMKTTQPEIHSKIGHQQTQKCGYHIYMVKNLNMKTYFMLIQEKVYFLWLILIKILMAHNSLLL